MLVDKIKELDKITDDFPGRNMRIGPDAGKFLTNERNAVFLGHFIVIFIEQAVDLRQFFRQDEQFFRRQGLKVDHGCQQVFVVTAEMPCRQARTQRFIAIDAAARIFHALRRTAENDA